MKYLSRVQAWLLHVTQAVTPLILDYDERSNTYPIRHVRRGNNHQTISYVKRAEGLQPGVV